MRLIPSYWHIARWLSQKSSRLRFEVFLLFSLLVALSPSADGVYMKNSVSTFLSTIQHLGQPKPGNLCSLDAQCSWTKDLVCADGRCECQSGKWDGERCISGYSHDDIEDLYSRIHGDTAAADQLANSYCLPSEIEKNGKCYIRRKPGEACENSEQCMNIGDIEYYCIANICQEPPECPPGFTAMGAECLPYSVTGGPCIHPSQCLTGSVCIKGKCRGPCDFNQLFLDESCVDYEGAGCVATSCISNRCPRSFPSCNYISQKRDYLCCDRSMETKVQCPLPNSEPQIDKETGSIVECMHRPCMSNYRCVFASYGRGKYICCSKPKKPRDESDLAPDNTEDYEENYGQVVATTRPPWIPPPPRPVKTPWTPQSIEASRWTTAAPWAQNNNWGSYGGNWNAGYGTWNGGNWNNAQGWIPNQGAALPQTWRNNNAAWNNYVGNQGWATNPAAWNSQQQWNYNRYTNNNGGGVAHFQRRIRLPFQGSRTRTSLNMRPGSWSTFVRTWPRKQSRSAFVRTWPRKQSHLDKLQHPGYLNESIDKLQHPGYLNESIDNQQQPVSTLIRPSSTLIKTVNGIATSPPQRTGLINAPWSYAVRVLIYWCCTNRICIYKDQLKDFCSRVINTHIYTYHVSKNLQSHPENEEETGSSYHQQTNQDEDEESSEPIKSSFPVKKDAKKR